MLSRREAFRFIGAAPVGVGALFLAGTEKPEESETIVSRFLVGGGQAYYSYHGFMVPEGRSVEWTARLVEYDSRKPGHLGRPA